MKIKLVKIVVSFFHKGKVYNVASSHNAYHNKIVSHKTKQNRKERREKMKGKGRKQRRDIGKKQRIKSRVKIEERVGKKGHRIRLRRSKEWKKVLSNETAWTCSKNDKKMLRKNSSRGTQIRRVNNEVGNERRKVTWIGEIMKEKVEW